MSEVNLQSFASLPISKITQKPVIHFAHANGMPSPVYEPFFEKLAEFFTIEYISMLGDTPDYPVDNQWRSLTQQIVDSVKDTCKKHGVKQVVAVGHSLGAMCTLQALYRAPEYFSQAVLMDPPWIYGKVSLLWHLAKTADRLPLMNNRLMDKLSPAGVSKHRRDVWDSREDAYDKLRHKGFFKDFTERSFQGYIEHGLHERADGKVTLAIPKASEVAVFRTNPSWYWLTPNRAPKVPVTLIIGEDSIFLKRRFPQQIKSRLRIPYITHAGGHMFPLEHPESVSEQVLALIEKQLSAK
ncbi:MULTISPECIES: alpha/beta fold hydrolase [unclassified Psychrobacter]|jgi:pimeloyl-ACP methyl ester carboxylesterase|uniref:alpha/beta fold hydrolase n=1 Tax=unclassified Psychrobacter TaxID=196806 RepID=UPI00191B2D58|nr:MULTISPECIES: alpha/beta hydrolase [unclassified Psychrobacter]WAI88262.1 2-succinyl-6-hydroxy-2,4-cyclohexadiene-1-carboxylate synthase [Psychrobacter sp. SC65A.3]